VTYLSLGGDHRFEGSEVSGACYTDNRSAMMIVSKGETGVTDM